MEARERREREGEGGNGDAVAVASKALSSLFFVLYMACLQQQTANPEV